VSTVLTGSPPLPWIATADRAAAGAPHSSHDEAAFQRLYAATSRPLWAYLMRSLRNAAEADELLQETYFRYFRSGKRTETEEHARNYLFRIAANLIRDEFRRRRVRTQTPAPPEEPSEPERAVRLRRDLGEALAETGDRDRQLLWLAHAEGFSHREIAAILGLKEASIRLMLFRARQRLAARLRERGLGPEVLQ
jgi:RNA polymerase sigma-70 factor, ECF subfamily